MRAFFLSGSIVFTVLVLILAFENIALSVNNFLFIFIPLKNPFLIVLGTAIVGIITGMFYAGLINSFVHRNDEEEEAGNEWQQPN